MPIVKIREFVPVLMITALALPLAMLPAAPPAAAAIGVLFETGHQREASDMSGYNNMINDLTSRGFSFTEDTDGNITEADLSGNSILVIVEPDDELSAAEISTIQSFINSGHGFLLMSDRLNARARDAVNSLLSPYNIQQSAVSQIPGVYTDITSHVITSHLIAGRITRHAINRQAVSAHTDTASARHRAIDTIMPASVDAVGQVRIGGGGIDVGWGDMQFRFRRAGSQQPHDAQHGQRVHAHRAHDAQPPRRLLGAGPGSTSSISGRPKACRRA